MQAESGLVRILGVLRYRSIDTIKGLWPSSLLFLLLCLAIITCQPLLAYPAKQQLNNRSGDSSLGPISSLSSSSSSSLSSLSSSSLPNQLRNVFNHAEKSVVLITSKSIANTSDVANEQQFVGEANQTILASGFIYDKEGHVVTNSHVLANARALNVEFADGNSYPGYLIGADPYSDIAVLNIVANNASLEKQQRLLQHLKPLALANSSEVEVGDPVVAIGNPYGLDNTMTKGIVSQIGRSIPSPVGAYSVSDVIQTDASLNPGNSGGPLLNLKGDVVGLVTGGLPGNTGFAVSSNTVGRIVPILISNGIYIHPSVGLTGTTFTSDLAQRFNNSLPPDLKGIVVDTVSKNRSADKAGVRGSTTDQYGEKHGGDIITAIDGKNITRFDHLVSYLEQNKSASDTMTLTLYRGGHYTDVKVILGERPTLLTSVASFTTPGQLPPSSPLPKPPNKPRSP
jgi:S1-C subfamily serine protease